LRERPIDLRKVGRFNCRPTEPVERKRLFSFAYRTSRARSKCDKTSLFRLVSMSTGEKLPADIAVTGSITMSVFPAASWRKSEVDAFIVFRRSGLRAKSSRQKNRLLQKRRTQSCNERIRACAAERKRVETFWKISSSLNSSAAVPVTWCYFGVIHAPARS